MKKGDVSAAVKGVLLGLLGSLFIFLFLLSLKLADRGVHGFIIALLIFSFLFLILGALIAIWVAPLVIEKFTFFVLGIHAEPYEPDTLIELAQCLIAQKRYKEAIEVYQEAKETEWINLHHWLKMATINREKLNAPQQAIDVLMDALEYQKWNMSEHLEILYQQADIHLNELDSPSASESIYNFIADTYGDTPYGETALKTRFLPFSSKSASENSPSISVN